MKSFTLFKKIKPLEVKFLNFNLIISVILAYMSKFLMQPVVTKIFNHAYLFSIVFCYIFIVNILLFFLLFRNAKVYYFIFINSYKFYRNLFFI